MKGFPFNRRAVGRWLMVAMLCAAAVASAAPPPPAVFATLVEPGQIDDSIEALGSLKANESVAITASVTEKIGALLFDDGERVAAGAVLVEMTSAEEHAQLKEAKALADEAARQYRRVQSLATQGTAAKSLLDERARELETARARLVAIESRLSDRLIKAPFSGVVGLRNISVGALVEPGDLITTLDDVTVMKLDLAVPSTYLEGVAPGLPVQATTAAFGERVFNGTIHSIDSRVDPVTRSLTVRVLIPNPDRVLKPGMLMQVVMRKNQREALLIPEGALLPKGREQFVLLALPAEDGGHKVEKRKIAIGSRKPGVVEVLQGLTQGDLVITHGTLRVRPGQVVELRALEKGDEPLTELLSQQAGTHAEQGAGR